MAVTSRSLARQPTRLIHNPSWRHGWLKRRWKALHQQLHMLTLVLILVAMPVLAEHGRTWLDDVRYGRPRTIHLSAYVGHGETAGRPTHFVAMNLNQRVVVLMLPGGDSTQAQILHGPYLFGAGERLTPILLRIQDMNQDGARDLVVGIKHEEIVYINTGESFRLLTDTERQDLIGAHP